MIKLRDLIDEKKCGIGQNPEDTGCEPADGGDDKEKKDDPRKNPPVPGSPRSRDIKGEPHNTDDVGPENPPGGGWDDEGELDFHDGPENDDAAVGDDHEEETKIVDAIADMFRNPDDWENPDFDKDAKPEPGPPPTPPNKNLCDYSVPGTNLFCDGNQGEPRKDMPQLKSAPEPGGAVDSCVKDPTGTVKVGEIEMSCPTDPPLTVDDGEVNAEEMFMEYLKKKAEADGEEYTDPIEFKDIPVGQLRATQNEIDGPKVAKFTAVLMGKHGTKKWQDNLTKPINVSMDNYILDGHHRWAAMVAWDLADGGGGKVKMKCRVIQKPMEELLQDSKDFTGGAGMASKGGGMKRTGRELDSKPKFAELYHRMKNR